MNPPAPTPEPPQNYRICKGIGEVSAEEITFEPSLCTDFEDFAGGITVQMEGDTTSNMIRMGGIMGYTAIEANFTNANSRIEEGVLYIVPQTALDDTTIRGTVQYTDRVNMIEFTVEINFSAA